VTREGRVLNRFFYRSSRFYFVSKNGRRFGSSLKTEGSAEDLKYSKRNEAKSHVTMKWQVVIFQRRCSNIPSPSFHPARCSSTTYSHSHPPPPVTMKKKTENLVFLRKENWRKKKPTIFSYFSKKSSSPFPTFMPSPWEQLPWEHLLLKVEERINDGLSWITNSNSFFFLF